MHIASITVYLSFHDLGKELIELVLDETKGDLDGPILEDFKFITEHDLLADGYYSLHTGHPRYLGLICFQILHELLDS